MLRIFLFLSYRIQKVRQQLCIIARKTLKIWRKSPRLTSESSIDTFIHRPWALSICPPFPRSWTLVSDSIGEHSAVQHVLLMQAMSRWHSTRTRTVACIDLCNLLDLSVKLAIVYLSVIHGSTLSLCFHHFLDLKPEGHIKRNEMEVGERRVPPSLGRTILTAFGTRRVEVEPFFF